MGATDAFEAIRAFGEHEHLEVAQTTHSIGPAAADEARARLFAFEALLRSHIDRQEQLLLPVLSEAPERTGEVDGAGLDG